jgi:hypothetical protein
VTGPPSGSLEPVLSNVTASGARPLVTDAEASAIGALSPAT